MKIIFSIAIFSIALSCGLNAKQNCFKSQMNNCRFSYVGGLANSVFEIKDSLYTEYVDKVFYVKAKVNWNNCSSYYLVIEKINYEQGLKVGDTLQVELLSKNADTITCNASAKSKTFPIRFFKIRTL